MSDSIQVLLADDHPAMRIGLRVLLDLTPDISVVAETSDGPETLTQIVKLCPHITVLDCQLPGLSGIEVAAAIKEQQLATKLLALSAYDTPRYQWSMLEMGAKGYMLKDEAPTEIVAAVRVVARGESLWRTDQLKRIRQWRTEVQARWEDLTAREQSVLSLIASSKSNKEIAKALNITPRTVEYHVGNILGKLVVTSRVEAALWLKAYQADSA